MPKDVIFSTTPKVSKVTPRLVGAYKPKRPKKMYLKSEINLEEWRKLDKNEKLEQGDILEYDDFRFAETNLIGCMPSGIGSGYYRRKKTTYDCERRGTVMDSNNNEYQILSPDTVLQKGDEFYHDETFRWFPTHIFGTKAGRLMIYRRLVGKQFTDEELKKADEHYHLI